MTIPSDVNFTSVSTKSIKFDRAIGGSRKESITVNITDEDEPHPDLIEALNAFSFWVVDVLDLGGSWLQSEVTLVDAGYTNIEEIPILSVRSISMSRASLDGELIIKRSVKMSKVCADDIPSEIIDCLEGLWDEAWLYATGQKTANNRLFEIDRTIKSIHKPIAVSQTLELVEA